MNKPTPAPVTFAQPETSEVQANRDAVQEALSGEKLRQQLVLQLKEKGPDDPKTQTLLQAWITEHEIAADATPDDEAVRIGLDVDRARVYFDAGFLEEARENFADAAEYARNMGMANLYDQIRQEMMEKKM